MSKLYCEILDSARRTVPTARAHTMGRVSVKNWEWALESSLTDRGGGGSDRVVVTLRNLNTGESVVLALGTVDELRESHRK